MKKLFGTLLCLGVSMLAQSKPSMTTFLAPEIAATGITLEPADANVELVKSLTGNDYAGIQPILPYIAVMTNGSQHRILAISIKFQWREPKTGDPADGARYTHNHFNADPPTQINPGESRLYAPHQGLSMYLQYPSASRKGFLGFFGSRVSLKDLASDFTFPHHYTEITTSDGKVIHPDGRGVVDVRATIEFVTLEGVGMVGPDNFFTQQNRKEFDRKGVYTINDQPEPELP